MTDTPTCRSCQAPVLMVRFRVSGKMAILDADPHEKGNIAVSDDGWARILKKDELAVARARGEQLYISHFATCPDADKWRKKKT